MKIFQFSKFLLALALLSGENLVYADTLAGVLWGGPKQYALVCTIYNAGPGTVNITSHTISDMNGNVLQISPGDGCNNASLVAGSLCIFGALAPAQTAGPGACRIVVDPSGANVRGVIDARDSSTNILDIVQLR